MENLSPSPAETELERNSSASERVKSGVESAKEEAAKLKQSASEQASASFENAKTNIKETSQKAISYGQDVVTEQKNRLAEIVHEYSQATKAASERLHEEGHASLGNRADEMAARLGRVSAYLRERKLSDIYYDAEDFTRRRPEIVFGMMFAAGLVAARFLKASSRGLSSNGRAKFENETNLFEPLVPAEAYGPEKPL